MRSIWKFPLKMEEKQTIEMPLGSKLLTVQMQNGVPTLWAEVDPNGEPDRRIIELFGTGHPMSMDMGTERRYIATVQQHVLVWHFYDRIS